MSIKDRSKHTNYKAMSSKQKVEVLEGVLKNIAKLLTTVTPMSNKKYASKVRTNVSYRTTPEQVQEFERNYENAPPNLYQTKSDLYRAQEAAMNYLTTLFFKSYADEHALFSELDVLEDSQRMQIMLMNLAREEMKNEIMKKYEEIRKTFRENKPKNLATKLAEIEKQEAEHMKQFDRDNIDDDRAMLVSLPSAGYILDGYEQKAAESDGQDGK